MARKRKRKSAASSVAFSATSGYAGGATLPRTVTLTEYVEKLIPIANISIANENNANQSNSNTANGGSSTIGDLTGPVIGGPLWSGDITASTGESSATNDIYMPIDSTAYGGNASYQEFVNSASSAKPNRNDSHPNYRRKTDNPNRTPGDDSRQDPTDVVVPPMVPDQTPSLPLAGDNLAPTAGDLPAPVDIPVLRSGTLAPATYPLLPTPALPSPTSWDTWRKDQVRGPQRGSGPAKVKTPAGKGGTSRGGGAGRPIEIMPSKQDEPVSEAVAPEIPSAPSLTDEGKLYLDQGMDMLGHFTSGISQWYGEVRQTHSPYDAIMIAANVAYRKDHPEGRIFDSSWFGSDEIRQYVDENIEKTTFPSIEMFDRYVSPAETAE